MATSTTDQEMLNLIGEQAIRLYQREKEVALLTARVAELERQAGDLQADVAREAARAAGARQIDFESLPEEGKEDGFREDRFQDEGGATPVKDVPAGGTQPEYLPQYRACTPGAVPFKTGNER